MAAAGATLATFPGVVGGILVLLYFYRRQRHLRAKLLAEQATDIIPESSWQIMKRLFVLAIPVSMANIMMPIVSGIDLGVVPQRLIDAGYSVREATTLFGYLTGMATSLVNLPIILTTSLAASLVPAISEAFSKKRHGGNSESQPCGAQNNHLDYGACVCGALCVGYADFRTSLCHTECGRPHCGYESQHLPLRCTASEYGDFTRPRPYGDSYGESVHQYTH